MAYLNEQTNEIIFNKTDLINAWANAPKISDANPDEFRVCMYCQFPMKKKHYVANHRLKHPTDAWAIDLINLRNQNWLGKIFSLFMLGVLVYVDKKIKLGDWNAIIAQNDWCPRMSNYFF